MFSFRSEHVSHSLADHGVWWFCDCKWDTRHPISTWRTVAHSHSSTSSDKGASHGSIHWCSQAFPLLSTRAAVCISHRLILPEQLLLLQLRIQTCRNNVTPYCFSRYREYDIQELIFAPLKQSPPYKNQIKRRNVFVLIYKDLWYF